MAGFKKEIKDGIITNTLNFKGKDYTETWTNEGGFCANPFDQQIFEDYPELETEDEEICEMISEFCSMDDDEMLETLSEFEVYERNNLKIQEVKSDKF